ncbi:hypothetical protein ACN47E_007500 [Coniothyrium glycines]
MSTRTLILLILSIVAFFSNGVFCATVETRELGLADIPPCGLTCMFGAVPAGGCTLDDIDCVCSNVGIAQTLAACMLANCTMADTESTARVQADMCNLSDESRRTEVFLYTVVVFSLAVLFVMLRIGGKYITGRLSWDDVVVVIALLLTIIPFACVLTMARLGFGEHTWNLEDGRLLPILKLFWISWSTYLIVLGLIKVSLVLFYLQLFVSRRFEVTAYIVLAYIVVNTLIIFFLTIFACKPVESFWNRDIKGKCMDIQGLGYANSASAITQDFILLILPIVFIRNLNTMQHRKIAAGIMFAVGTFGCITTILRLRALMTFEISIDPTWDFVSTTIWTELELAAIFLCVSLPAIRLLVVNILPTRVHEFCSRATRRSSENDHARNKNLPAQPMQNVWKEPAGWSLPGRSTDVEAAAEFQKPERSVFNNIWQASPFLTRKPGPQLSLHEQGSRKLHSVMSNYSESGVATTRPPYREVTKFEDQHEPSEPGRVAAPPKTHSVHSCKSCESLGEQFTALPKIGCLPERSYSDLHLTRPFRGADRKRSRDGRRTSSSK